MMNYSKNMKNYKRFRLMFAVALLIGLVAGFFIGRLSALAVHVPDEPEQAAPTTYQAPLVASATPQPTARPTPTPEPTPEPESEPLFTEEELHAVALTLSGECYDDELEDKRGVAWVICNRVSDGRFGEGIIGVVSSTAHGVQFCGYWDQGRPISDSDWGIAAEVLAAYFAGEQAPHDYLYFTGGTGKTNNFR